MHRRPTATPGGPCAALALRLAAPVAFLALALAPAHALAGHIRESDLVVSSTVGKIATSAEGDKADAKSETHSLDIKRGSRTGEMRISGQAGRVTTQAGGQNTSADSAVGGISVGGDK
jgi:hypothetical protein